MKLSLIIPMYNVEQYIENCLNSCINQDLPKNEYEIIIVNDGSPDNSLAIAEIISKKVANITIVSQKNAGLSSARNKGLSLAKGKYIWFIDSDDTIKQNCINQIVTKCYEEDLDILAICAANIKNNKVERCCSYSKCNIEKGCDVINKIKIPHCAPFTIYKREFLNKYNLKFYEGIYHEDSEWSPRVYYLAERVGFTNEILYFVTINPSSITRTVNPKKGFDCLIVAKSLDNFYNNYTRKDCSTFFHNYISLMINNALSNFADCHNELIKKDLSQFKDALYKSKHLFSHLLSSSIIKYKIEGILFIVFPRKIVEIYRFMLNFKI